jgi:hypothetical protein
MRKSDTRDYLRKRIVHLIFSFDMRIYSLHRAHNVSIILLSFNVEERLSLRGRDVTLEFRYGSSSTAIEARELLQQFARFFFSLFLFLQSIAAVEISESSQHIKM